MTGSRKNDRKTNDEQNTAQFRDFRMQEVNTT